MNSNGWCNFEDLFRACGYNNSSESKDNTGCNDIPNGFQNINPELFVIISEILGNIIAGNTPSNVQSVIGNWFELVGQVILTFNAQQQYFESGPGRFFDPKNYNIDNPSCSNNSASSKSSESSTSTSSNKSTSSKTSSSKSNDINTDKIEELEKKIQELTSELNEIKILLQKE